MRARGRPMWDKDKLKSFREQLGKSRQEFADLVGVAVNTLRDWEQGVTPIPLVAQKLLSYLKQDLAAVPAA